MNLFQGNRFNSVFPWQLLGMIYFHLPVFWVCLVFWIAANKHWVLTASLVQICLRSSTDEDGVSGGSAGGGGCCDWDGDPAHHPGSDRYSGPGNADVNILGVKEGAPFCSGSAVGFQKCWTISIWNATNKCTWQYAWWHHFWISDDHDVGPQLSNRSHGNTGPASQRTDGPGARCDPGRSAVCHPVPTDPDCAGITLGHRYNTGFMCCWK